MKPSKLATEKEMRQYINKLESESKWIRVEDRLPDESSWNDYLCYTEEGYMVVQDYDGGSWYDEKTDSGWVTHWRELPSEPHT